MSRRNRTNNEMSNVSDRQREVELRIIFLRIGEIDTQNEKFFAEILVEAKWEEPKLSAEFDQRLVREEKELSSANALRYWNPKIYIENALNDPSQATISYKMKKEISKECSSPDDMTSDFTNVQFKFWIYEYRKVKGYFFEKLELEYFPIDTQSMSIVMTSYRSNVINSIQSVIVFLFSYTNFSL